MRKGSKIEKCWEPTRKMKNESHQEPKLIKQAIVIWETDWHCISFWWTAAVNSLPHGLLVAPVYSVQTTITGSLRSWRKPKNLLILSLVLNCHPPWFWSRFPPRTSKLWRATLTCFASSCPGPPELWLRYNSANIRGFPPTPRPLCVWFVFILLSVRVHYQPCNFPAVKVASGTTS